MFHLPEKFLGIPSKLSLRSFFSLIAWLCPLWCDSWRNAFLYICAHAPMLSWLYILEGDVVMAFWSLFSYHLLPPNPQEVILGVWLDHQWMAILILNAIFWWCPGCNCVSYVSVMRVRDVVCLYSGIQAGEEIERLHHGPHWAWNLLPKV